VRAPDGWSNTFPEPRLCAAIVDRLTFGGQIIETGTDSYRLTRTALNTTAAAQTPAPQPEFTEAPQQTLEIVP
jgi:hypothetical protein